MGLSFVFFAGQRQATTLAAPILGFPGMYVTNGISNVGSPIGWEVFPSGSGLAYRAFGLTIPGPSPRFPYGWPVPPDLHT